eukprot:m.47316 g.47316  ORF g.47316 m.47316 type:complete len:61 (-) comp10758_c1_seq1:717-899(-)
MNENAAQQFNCVCGFDQRAVTWFNKTYCLPPHSFKMIVLRCLHLYLLLDVALVVCVFLVN